MNIAITGSSGFIGQRLVQKALNAGHAVTSFGRQPAAPNDNVQHHCIDISQQTPSKKMLDGSDVLIHLAAAMHGSRQARVEETVKLTQNTFDAAYDAGIRHFIMVSSLSVLDYSANPNSNIDEDSTLNLNSEQQGDYAFVKTQQEIWTTAWFERHDCTSITVRPGLVYDKDAPSDAHAGFIKKGAGIMVKHSGNVPLVSLENTVNAILACCSSTIAQHAHIHLLDNAVLSQTQYCEVLKRNGAIKLALPLPWKLYAGLCKIPATLLRVIGLGSKIPDAFIEASVNARFKPFTFTNTHARKLLNIDMPSNLNQ